jgi:hypothetical protein
VAPDDEQAIVIERVTPSAPPDKSIVALRQAQGEALRPAQGNPERRRRVAAR